MYPPRTSEMVGIVLHVIKDNSCMRGSRGGSEGGGDWTPMEFAKLVFKIR